MSTVEFHPWNSRRADVEKPDQWRIDIDPMPRCPFDRVLRVATVVHEVLDELGAVGLPKTSGAHGLHVYVRIAPEHDFGELRRGALAFAREAEWRIPRDATTTWWRKDRPPGEGIHRLQPEHARSHDRQRVLGTRNARRSWSQHRSPGRTSTTRTSRADDCDRPRHASPRLGYLHAGIDQATFKIDPLLDGPTVTTSQHPSKDRDCTSQDTHDGAHTASI